MSKTKWIIGGALVTTIALAATKGRGIWAKLSAANSLTYDLVKLSLKGVKAGSANIELVSEVTNHRDTSLMVTDLIVDVIAPNGVVVAKVNQKLNKTLAPRERTRLIVNVKANLIRSGVSLADTISNLFASGSAQKSDNTFTIKGSMLAEGFTLDIDEKIGSQISGVSGLNGTSEDPITWHVRYKSAQLYTIGSRHRFEYNQNNFSLTDAKLKKVLSAVREMNPDQAAYYLIGQAESGEFKRT